MAHIFLSLGTNLGDKATNLLQAVQLLAASAGQVLRVSDSYETVPWGFDSENHFLNNVVEMETVLSPQELLKMTQNIERKLGRVQKSTNGYADRVIDIDILLYDDQIVDLPELKIPHPLLTERDFVLIPLCQLAGALKHPVTGKPFSAYRC